MLSRGVACLCTACPERGRRAPLSVPKNPAAKSRVSTTYKLIESKGLQLHCFDHLQKTGGRGSYRLVYDKRSCGVGLSVLPRSLRPGEARGTQKTQALQQHLVGKNYRGERNTGANLRTGTALQRNHSCAKLLHACDLAALVCDMLLKEVRGEHMEGELFYKTAFCTEYERLLCACVQSLDIWKNRREEIANSVLRKWEAGDELLRLQADYAKAYSRLEKHIDNCTLCHFVSKISGRNYASLSTAVMDKKHSA
jgi:hypothetical protein